MANRITVVLLTLTVLLQGVILYRQGGRTPPKRESVLDAPKGTPLQLNRWPSEGNEQAKVVLIEFSDYECPFCARHATSVAGELKREFIDTGNLRHVFVNLPLPNHKNATPLATAAVC